MNALYLKLFAKIMALAWMVSITTLVPVHLNMPADIANWNLTLALQARARTGPVASQLALSRIFTASVYPASKACTARTILTSAFRSNARMEKFVLI